MTEAMGDEPGEWTRAVSWTVYTANGISRFRVEDSDGEAIVWEFDEPSAAVFFARGAAAVSAHALGWRGRLLRWLLRPLTDPEEEMG